MKVTVDRELCCASGMCEMTAPEVFALAESEGVPPAVAADRIAEQRMTDAAVADGDRGIWLP